MSSILKQTINIRLRRNLIPILCLPYFFNFESSHAFQPNRHHLRSTSWQSTGTQFSTKVVSQSSLDSSNEGVNDTFCSNVLFVECGFGNDSHGQSSTKAAVRACRNAIEFNSIPSIGRLVPGGYDKLELDIILAVPPKYQSSLDLNEVEKVFPYGKCKFTIQDGGMVAPSCIAIESLGDKNEDMVIVCASIRVGY